MIDLSIIVVVVEILIEFMLIVNVFG